MHDFRLYADLSGRTGPVGAGHGGGGLLTLEAMQRLASGVLAERPAMLGRNGIRAPALIVIGETAALATDEPGLGAGPLPGISSASWSGVALAG